MLLTAFYTLGALFVLVKWWRARHHKRAPSKLTLTPLEITDVNTLRVAWNVPTIAANQRPLVFVAVETRTDASLPFQEVARAGAVASPGHTDLTLDDGAYDVRIRANDGTEFGPYSDVGSIVLAGLPPVFVPPSKPEGMTLSQIA